MIQTFPTPERLADAVARHIVAHAAAAIAATGRFTLALAGGSTPRAAYSRLATGDSGLELDWQRTHVIWSDERCVPPDDPRSNYRMAKEALLDRVPIPASQIHRMRGEDDPEKAAADYERELRDLLCHPERSEGAKTPGLDGQPPSGPFAALRVTNGLDLVLLGLGEDGHTASLFPGQAGVRETARWVVATLNPDATMWRITLTPAVLNAARNVTFVVSGASKAARLQQVLQGPSTPDILPAQAIRPAQGQLTWMVDETAAGKTTAHHGDTENTEVARTGQSGVG
jgi:6-phosphogluconolactonase